MSSSPSGEYRLDTITWLYDGWSVLGQGFANRIAPVRDRGGSTTQVHRHEYLRFVLWWDETTLDHGLHDEDANDGQ